MLRLAADLMRAPRRALDRIVKGTAFADSLRIYAVYLATAVLFYALKPQGFPPLPSGAPELQSGGGLLFWAKVFAWGPLLTAALVAATAGFVLLLRGGSLIVRMLLAGGCACLPLALIVVYTNPRLFFPMPVWGFVLGWGALLAGLCLLLRRFERRHWDPLASLLLAVNAVSVAMLPLFAAAVALRAERSYHALELAMVFWTLGLSAYGIRRVTGIQTPRALGAVFLAVIFQVLFIFSMYLAGILPKDVLMALLTV